MVSPTNSILTGLAVADMLVMLDYMPFTIHNYIRMDQNVTQLYSYEWSNFTLFHAHFSVVCHTISTWLTVLLAVWRYLAVSYPTDSKTWCTQQSAWLAIICTYIIVPICCTPAFLSYTIVRTTIEGQSVFRVDYSEISLKNHELLKKANFWVFGVGTKLVPCILLTYFSLALIRVLVEADKRKQRLHQNRLIAKEMSRSTQEATNIESEAKSSHNVNDSKSKKKNSLMFNSKNHCNFLSAHQQQSSSTTGQSSDRTTRMLLAVLLLFLITEFPSGILALLSGVIGEKFHVTVYLPLGELLDMLALVNSAINFILYCTMSHMFRKTFTKLFCIKKLNGNAAAATAAAASCHHEAETIHIPISDLKTTTKIFSGFGRTKAKATDV